MKKLFVLFLILSLILPAAAMGENARRKEWEDIFSPCSLDELLTINAALQNVLFEKKIGTVGVEVPPGTYMVGTDFPAGSYRVEFPTMTDFTFGSFTAMNLEDDTAPYYSFYININHTTKIGKLDLKDGMKLDIGDVSAVFYTYTGLFN